ncbi:MAG: EamA family transporter RarD [bacterium]|nr:EamA family transporter RarD [bacterium]
MSEHQRGVLCAVGAYLSWGLMPLFWKTLHAVPAPQLLAHRIVWSCVFLAILLALRHQAGTLLAAARRPGVLRSFSLAAGLISVNWLTYVWAVNAGHIVDTSLGYFINPLLNVVLGVLVLKERLRAAQWWPMGLAAVGVAWLTVSHGSPPWIALVLAFSFGLYSLVKKTSPLGSVQGMALETALLAPLALIWLIHLEVAGSGVLGRLDSASLMLVLATGPVTALPLLLFAAGARRISLSLVGLLQYLAPTIQFLIGVFIYHEPFSGRQLAGFSLVWAALLLFAAESLWRTRMCPTATVETAQPM